jgi:hypothetical protein
MALTLSRWAVIVVLAGAAVGVALLPVPPRTFRSGFQPSQSTRVQRLTGQLERARDQLRVAALGDSVLDILKRSPLPAGGRPTILDLGASTEEERRAFARNLEEWWPDSLPGSTVAVALVLGGDARDMTWQEQHMLPASGDGRTCATLVPTQTWKLAAKMPGPAALDLRFSTELGPCLFLATFGRPGPRIEQWLGGRGLDFIGYLNPAGRTVVESATRPDDAPIQSSLLEMEWAIYEMMPLGIQCLQGAFDECAARVASPDTAPVLPPPGFHAPTVPWRAPFGSLTGSFIADLYREIGFARFQEFWRSTGTVDQAMNQATGKTLGEWTHQWALGWRGGFRSGPLPEKRSVVRVAGLSLLLLAAAVAFSVRRTVG